MANIISDEIRTLLDQETVRINTPKFIESDPVQFPRRFTKIQDIEIAAIISATIAWGKRTMICKNADKILNLMDNQPFNFVMEKAYENLSDDMNLHRTFFGVHLKQYLRGLNLLYQRHSSIDAFIADNRVGETDAPAWEFAKMLQQVIREANNGELSSRCLPVNLQSTALKRINMALRWLVRDDGIVDMGIWKSIPKSALFIPLDVHVSNTSRELGLLMRKSNDRRAVEELTDTLRQIRPSDPAIYDFALFGIGMGLNTDN